MIPADVMERAPTAELLAIFGDKLTPYFLLAELTLEAEAHVVKGALPMNNELAAGLLDLQREWNALREGLQGR